MSEGQAAPAAAPAAAPVAAPASAAAALGAEPAPAAAPAADTWYSNVDQKHHGLIESRHWENMDSVLESYDQLHKLRGVAEDQLLRMPLAEDADGFNEVYNKLGRPESPDGYTFKKGEDWSDDYTSWYKETVHELGLNDKQAAALQEKHDQYEKATIAANTEKVATQQALDMKDLTNEWGAAYEQKMMTVKTGAEKLGWTNEHIQILERVIGTKAMMNTLANIGESMGESKFHGGSSTTQVPANGAMTREAALARYQEIKGDPAFRARLLSKDPVISKAAQDERHEVSRMAHD